MPTLDDLPTLVTNVNPSGADLIPVYDVDSPNSSKVEKLPLSGILGLQAADVSTGGDASVIATRLFIATGTSPADTTPSVTLPAAAGNLRQVIVMNTATGSCTIACAGSDTIVTGTNLTAASLAIATSHAAILLSDGTKWYHISNDT